MGAQSCLRRSMIAVLGAAVLDLERGAYGRRRVVSCVVRAGKDRQRLRLRADREGSMCVVRAEFQGETEWYALLDLSGGYLRIRSGYGGGFLRRAGSGDVASWLARFSEWVETEGFKRFLLREACRGGV